jgi:hypothetical protein
MGFPKLKLPFNRFCGPEVWLLPWDTSIINMVRPFHYNQTITL